MPKAIDLSDVSETGVPRKPAALTCPEPQLLLLQAAVTTRLEQALKLSCLSERLLDLSRTGISAATVIFALEQCAPYFVTCAAAHASSSSVGPLSLLAESLEDKIQGLSLSHNPQIGPSGIKALLNALTRFVFASCSSSLTGCVPSLPPVGRHCLQVLDLYNVGLTDQSVPDLLLCMERGAPVLSKLKIGDNHITAAGMQLMLLRPGAFHHVQQIHLGGNPLMDEGVRFFAMLLVSMPCLTNIGLRDVCCHDSGLSHIFDSLLVRHRQMCSAAAVAASLEMPRTSLAELQLRGNSITHVSTMEKLCLCFREGAMDSLVALDIANCKAPDMAMARLYACLSSCTAASSAASSFSSSFASSVKSSPALLALREVDFCGNSSGQISAEPLKYLLESVTTTIVSLNLAQNPASGAGWMSVALQGLAGNKTISNLCLSQNSFPSSLPHGAASAAAIAQALSLTTCQLCMLDITGCNIGPAGMSQIFLALSANNARTKVFLMAGNAGGMDCVGALIDMITHNSHITTLHFQDNNIPVEGMVAVTNAIVARNWTLRQLSFGGQSAMANGITPCIRQELNQAMGRNKRRWEEEKLLRWPSSHLLQQQKGVPTAATTTIITAAAPDGEEPRCSFFAQRTSLWDMPDLFAGVRASW